MPYSVSSPPKKTHTLSSKGRRQWVHVFNSALKGGASEQSAHQQAWAAVRNSKNRKDQKTKKRAHAVPTVGKVNKQAAERRSPKGNNMNAVKLLGYASGVSAIVKRATPVVPERFNELPPGFESLRAIADNLPWAGVGDNSAPIELGEVPIRGLPQKMEIINRGSPGIGSFLPPGNMGGSSDLMKALVRQQEYNMHHMGPPTPEPVVGPPAPLGPVHEEVPFPYDPTLRYNASNSLARKRQLAGLPPPSMEDLAQLVPDYRIDGMDMSSPLLDVPMFSEGGPVIDPGILAAADDAIPHPDEVSATLPKSEGGDLLTDKQMAKMRDEAVARDEAHSKATAEATDESPANVSFADKVKDIISKYGGPAALGMGGLGALNTFLHNRGEEDKDKLRSYLPWLLLGGLGGYQTYKGMK